MKKLFPIMIGLALFTAAIYNFTQPFKPFIQRAAESEIIAFKPQKLSSLASDFLIYPVADDRQLVYQSNEIEPDQTFTSVALEWIEAKNENAFIHAQIRFRENGAWTHWLSLEEEHQTSEVHLEEHGSEPEALFSIASTNGAQAFQYRFILDGPAIDPPKVSNLTWTALKTAPPKSRVAASVDDLSAVNFSANSPNIITRAQWGANESHRYLPAGQEQEVYPRQGAFYEKFADELEYSRVVPGDENGLYKWPLQYPEAVKKFVIHHTATTEDLDNPTNAINDIYTYHTNVRGWGDIGYNYIVDREGRIYEGRAGGEGVIAAHAPFANHGSIGIAVLGSYQSEEVPEQSVLSLSHLVAYKSKIHNIDPAGLTVFREILSPNVLAHRDVDATTCPGDYLYNKIPVIRTIAAQDFKEKPKFQRNYDFQNRSGIYYLELDPFESRMITIKLENIGTKTWDSNTYLLANEDPNNDHLLTFPFRSDDSIARMNENSVKPGQIATFDLLIEAKNHGGTAYLDLRPMANGSTKIDEEFTFPVGVVPPIYDYQILDSEIPSGKIKAGSEFTIEATLKNKGNVAWEKDNFTLRGSRGHTLIMDATRVEPNETATFRLQMPAPHHSGSYSETFRPEIAGIKFLSEETLDLNVKIYNYALEAQKKLIPQINNFPLNQETEVAFTLENIGTETWKASDFALDLRLKESLEMSDLSLSRQTVKPDETVTISFKVTPTKLANGYLFINAKIKDQLLLNTPAILKFKVLEAQEVVEPEMIRIKLSFDGEPEVTASSDFRLYQNDKLIDSKEAGEVVEISEPTRIVPSVGGIVEIINYENRPAWNLALNDNQFRGELDILQEGNDLIVVNELPLEDYLKGLGEVSNTAEEEKIKALMVAARTYAIYYTTVDRKFPNKPYDLDDDPEVSQKYLGYGLEKRSPKVSAGVQATSGEVVYYNGKLVKTPYFNQTDGTFTKSAQEVWGWTNTPYLVPVSDNLCNGDRFLGHGVGLSGCGASAMAQNGDNYRDILKHYYSGIDIVKLY